jgi:putative hydrolase of the HAD superfamily
MTRKQTGSIDAVVFDFGGVFTSSPFAAVDAVAAEFGIPGSVITELVFGPYERDTDHPWHRLERGEVSVVDARKEIIAQAASQGLKDFDPIQVLVGMKIDHGARKPVVDLVRRLRTEGYRTALLTNNVREFSTAWRQLIPVDELFDLVVDSSEVGMRKPDPAIFHLTLERLGGHAPERTLFLDDYDGNVRAARAIGIEAVLVGEDPEPALEETHRRLGLEPSA